jgi:N-acetylglucosamine malate deacetylase 1
MWRLRGGGFCGTMTSMSNPYRAFVATIAQALADGARLPRGKLLPATQPLLPATAPVAVVLAPHPDDECIIGGLPLRLRREAGMRVVDIAVTLGSNRERRDGRRRELEGACQFLGFDVVVLGPGNQGLDRVTPAARTGDPAHWNTSVDALAAALERAAPSVIFLPHGGDWNGTHVGTHHLGMDALHRLGNKLNCAVVETEYWGAMTAPNLMVESSAADVGDLCAAAGFHEGEVARNPYHLRLPAWMVDNVRRGGELIAGQGGTPPDFAFATLYRMNQWQKGHLEPPAANAPKWLAAAAHPRTLFSGARRGTDPGLGH